MAMYPPSVANLRAAIEPFPGLAARTDTYLAIALRYAQSEIETQISDAAAGALSPRLDKVCYQLALDWAVWKMRYDNERDPETNDVPRALARMENHFLRRLNGANLASQQEGGTYEIDQFDCLPAPDLPESGIYQSGSYY